MAKLIYSAITSLDGFTEGPDGRFDWGQPDEEVHTFVNDLERGVGTYLLGRRMYETMAAWETDESLATATKYTRDFAQIWQAAEKVVFSRTLTSAYTQRTRIERDFDPGAVREMKGAAESDLAIGGPDLARHAIGAGLVDELHLLLSPIVVGSGKPALPEGIPLDLDLLDQRHFGNGMVHLSYRVRQ